jgi:hypothetical protein
MDTRFHYDLAQKQLCFALKECVTTEPDIQLRFKGLLNTVTGGFQYRATLKKYVSTGTLLKGEGTTPLRIGGGVAISSDSKDEPFLTATCTKKIALLDGPDTLLHAKASVDYELRTQKVRGARGEHPRLLHGRQGAPGARQAAAGRPRRLHGRRCDAAPRRQGSPPSTPPGCSWRGEAAWPSVVGS